jgi:predicted phosphate transport protein (TIGR00153 family)
VTQSLRIALFQRGTLAPFFQCCINRNSSHDFLVKLFSKDEGFFDAFRQLADLIAQSARLLGKVFDNPRESANIAAEIKKLERAGDNIVHDINQRIDTSFVTPLDREDIHLLAKRLDNVIDLIHGTSRRVVIFRVMDARDGAKQMSGIIEKCGAEIQASIGSINKRQEMVEHSKTIKALEEEGDVLYAQAVARLFEVEVPALDVIKWMEIYEKLEEAIDECEDVSNVLESIALKNS